MFLAGLAGRCPPTCGRSPTGWFRCGARKAGWYGYAAVTPLSHGPYQRAKQRLTVAAIFLAWLARRGHQLGECTQHDLDSWFAAAPCTRQHP
jgi:hypothetical protein